MNDALREFVQSPDRYTQIPADVDRFADERVCVLQGNTWAAVSGVRVDASDVDALVAEVHERVAVGKSLTWWLDPDIKPPDLHERLLSPDCESRKTAAPSCTGWRASQSLQPALAGSR